MTRHNTFATDLLLFVELTKKKRLFTEKDPIDDDGSGNSRDGATRRQIKRSF